MTRKEQFSTWVAGVIGLAVSLALTTPGWAQVTVTATISGTVTDASGAVVPQTKVVVTNEGTHISASTLTNADGSYAFPALTVGTYTVTVSKEGFQTKSVTGIILHPAQATAVNMTMTVGMVATEVTVASSAAQVQTSTSELSSAVAEQQVITLPLNGRNYQSLSALMPGVTNITPGVAQYQGGFLTSNAMSINGMGQSGTFYTLDGIWNMNSGDMTQTTITPNPDTIQEVRVLQNNYGVQYSLMGSNVVVLETKSGTEQFHGTAYEYFRNDALDARNFFSPTVPALKQNIFGYTIGGPVYIPNHYNTKKDKTFFFWSQQWVRQHIASTVLGTTPTAAERNGDFSALCTTGFTAGICSTASEQLKNPVTGAPFLNNNIVTSTTPLNTSSLALLSAQAPPPNYGAPGAFLNYINLTPTINTQRDDEIRIDHNFSSKLRLLGEHLDERQVNKNSYDTFLVSPYATSTEPIITRNQLAQLQLTATLSPTMVNTIAVAMNNYVVDLNLAGTYKRSQVPGFAESLPYEGGFGSDRPPQINMGQGHSPLGVSYLLPLTHASDLEDTLNDDWTWLRGNHYIQAAINIVFGTKRQTDFSASNGEWGFSGQFTGNAIADYLLGDPANFYQQSAETRPYVHYSMKSPHVQDRWKATRKLTVTAGLRMLYEPVPHAQVGYASAFAPKTYNRANAPIVNADGSITATPTYNPLNGIIINGKNGVPLNFSNAHN